MAPNSNSKSGLSTAFASAAKVPANAKRECNLFINGVWYDLAQFVNVHPGGDIILHYHDKDATDVFEAFHSKETIEKLPLRKKVEPAPAAPAAFKTKTADAFREFRKSLEDEGLFETNYLWYLYKTCATFALFFIAIALMRYGYPIVGAFVMGLFWQQMGWLSHDYCHHEVFKTRLLNDQIAVFCGNFVQGFSVTWWKDRHNSHHGSTNIVGNDPDLDNLPLMVWSKKDLPRMRDMPLSRKAAQYQVVYFWFVLALLRLIWMFQSHLFVRSMFDSHNKVWRNLAKTEYIAINLHYALQLWILWQCPLSTWPAVFMISNCVAGFGIGVVVFFNHYGAHHYSKEKALEADFLILQSRTTRNMAGPRLFLDYMCGGLHLQLEHHLFPAMPRHNLRKAQDKTRAFMKKQGLPYLESDFVSGLGIAAQQLIKMSKHVADYDMELSMGENKKD